MCRYTQNIEVPHCADAPDSAAHQRLLRLRPRCLGQRRRLWSHKVFFFDCFVFVFACLDLFRRSSGFVKKFASTVESPFHLRELKIDEVKSLDPVNLRKINMSDFLEAMKRIKKWADLVLQKIDNDQPSGRCRRTAWCRTKPGTRSLGRAPPRSNLICYAFVTLYIYIASQASLSLFI